MRWSGYVGQLFEGLSFGSRCRSITLNRWNFTILGVRASGVVKDDELRTKLKQLLAVLRM